MSSAKAQVVPKDVTDANIGTKLASAIDTYVKNQEKSGWDLYDIFDDVRYSTNYEVKIIMIMARQGYAKKHNIPWKGLSKHPNYNSFSTILSRIKFVLTHSSYQQWKETGKTFTEVWTELVENQDVRNLKIDVDKMQRRATKATQELHEKTANRKELIAKKGGLKRKNKEEEVVEESPHWTAHPDGWDMYEEWKKSTIDVLRDAEGRDAFRKIVVVVARKRPKLFTSILKDIVEAGYLPTGVLMEIEE